MRIINNKADYDGDYMKKIMHSYGILNGCTQYREEQYGIETDRYIEVGSTFDAFRKLLDNPVFAKRAKEEK
jgi:anionic cell wall polymer biosynthesis LytR-Cps2A-Psr (LCP) family protein